jgi:transcriptional antiterminator NusG
VSGIDLFPPVQTGPERKGGEALPHDDASWFVLWTHSHSERLVHDQLTARGFETFLPTLTTWSRRKGAQSAIETPMFPGYVFIRHAIDKTSYIDIVKTRGLVRILGERWDRLTAVADIEIDAVRVVAASGIPAFPHPYLREGQCVRITDGPLSGVEGLLVATKPQKGLLVVSVELLQRSVAVEVDCTRVQPVSAPYERLRSGPAARAAAAWGYA